MKNFDNNFVVIISKNPVVYDERVKKEAVTLGSMGFNVIILCRKDFNIPKSGEQYYRIPDIQKTNNYSVISIEDNGEIDFNLRCFNIIRKIRPSVVWCIDGNTMLAGALSKFFIGNNITFVDFHEILYERDTLRNRKFRKLYEKLSERIYSKYFDFFLSVSPLSSKILKKDLKIKKKLITIHNSPNKVKFPNKNSVREKFNIPLKRKIIVYEGIIFPGRGLEFVLQNLHSLPDLYFYLVGPDRYYGYFEKLCEQYGVSERVVKMPLMSHAEMMEFIAVGDIGFLGTEPTCINHSYTLANKMYEYTMSGVPVIASNVPAYRCFVLKNKIGEVFDFHNPGTFVEGINELFNNKHMRENLTKFSKKYCWEKQEEKLRKIFIDFDFEKKELDVSLCNKKIEELNLKEVLVTRTAPFNVCDIISENYPDLDLKYVIQPSIENDFRINYELDYILFPENGFFDFRSMISISFIRNLLAAGLKDVLILSSENNISDKWRLILFFKILGFNIYKFTNKEIIEQVRISDLFPLIRIFFEKNCIYKFR